MTFPMPRAPKITLPRVDYREWYGFNPRINAYQVTGTENVDIAIDKFAQYKSSSGWGDVALDIETKGVDDGWWQITCITAAFHTSEGIVSVLLNPLRETEHRKKLRRILDLADRTVFHNCFSGDTRLITRDGVRTFEEVSGETVEVWDGNAWREADAKCYGTAPTQRIVVCPADHPASVRHEFNATPNHRWELVDGRLVTTNKLTAGDRIKASKPVAVIDHNSDAFKHGLIFAGGSLFADPPVDESAWAVDEGAWAVDEGVWGFRKRLREDAAKWVSLFDEATYPPSLNGDPVVMGKLTFNPKALPENPDADYIANFIEGWQLIDGEDYGNSRIVGIASEDVTDWLAAHAPTGGWHVTTRTSSTIRHGNNSKEPKSFHTVVLFKDVNIMSVEWLVVSVDAPTDSVPVYCVEVPGVERFTLAEGVYTANSTFDTPPMVAHELMTLDDVNKIWDTLVLARMLNTVDRAGRSLEDLAVRYGIVPDDGIKMASVFSASGMGSASRGFAEYDIDSGTYRDGAMSDTVVTLRLLPILEEAVTSRHDAAITPVAGLVREEAWKLVCELQRVNQISLRRAARGYLTDPNFRDTYEKKTSADLKDAQDALSAVGLEPGRGDKLIEHLYGIGQIPSDWPKTPTGKLSADKSAIKRLTELGHPLAAAHRTVADTTKILGYLEKVNDNVRHTGRLHPMIGVLGAAATGRMCIPVTHGMLSRRGVLSPDEIRVGDETLSRDGKWTAVTAIHRYADAEIDVREHRSARLESTPEHRWVLRDPWKTTTIVEPIDGKHRSVVLTPFDSVFDPTETEFNTTTEGERFAALVGLLVSDGRCVEGTSGEGMRAYVYQTEGGFYEQFKSVIPEDAVMFDRVTADTGKGPHHEIRLKTRWLRPRLEEVGLVIREGETLAKSPSLIPWVLGLTQSETREFVRAIWFADGSRHSWKSPRISMDSGALIDAFRVAVYKIGCRVTIQHAPPSPWSTKPRTIVGLIRKPHPRVEKLHHSKSRSDVWCVSTEDGTFTAWSDHMGPYLTGNSVTGTELHQFPGDARGILISDTAEGWSSVDWSTIEPVTMAVCAGDNGFLEPFFNGGDLYIPVARAAGLIPPEVSDEDAAGHKGRKAAKVIILAAMYGQGKRSLAASLAAALKKEVTTDEAGDLHAKLKAAMPVTFNFMRDVQSRAEMSNTVITITGRVLDEEPDAIYRAVNHFCVTPDTPVLTADLRYVRADSVRAGDELVGFDEYRDDNTGQGSGKRRFRTATVKSTNFVMKPSMEVHSSDGKITVCSEDHLWLVRTSTSNVRYSWVKAVDLTPEHQLLSLGTWEAPDSWDAGYLAGLFDGEGSMQTRASGKSCTQLTFHQLPGQVMADFRAAMDRLGLTYTFIPKSPNNSSPCDGVRVSGVGRMMKTVGMLRPHRMISRAKDIFDGSLVHTTSLEDTPHVTSVKSVGVRKVVAIATSTRTFIANGYLSHNCQGSAADVLYQSTLELDRQGLSDHIHLWMHDELIVDTSVESDVVAAMQKPPEALMRWARTNKVMLRTDANPMGGYWKAV